ncbi:VanS: trasncriptional regulator of van glycopeptide resistance genes (plasmid) [Caballeronia sp. SBC1]|uniref:sensor histidine kinase n=1 Tax=unclassified Caballeronia TaxID=2646786 RepID=UPI0013E1D23A|nr:VanS: trasncriptional regulator of van glycopeptide resistance genes [Caballeronia sp. SBC2]QIN65634.1 VanS: trasncriptional regulator of van glycopeptide resistance genes [Caballeronia sp. SBC1]
MTTSFSGTVDTGRAPRPEAPVAGTDGVLVLDTAQRCVSADTVFAHLFDLDASAFEGCALADTALPKPLIAVLAEAADAALAASSVRRAKVCIDESEGTPSRSRSFAILALPGSTGRTDTVSLIVSPSSPGGHGLSAETGAAQADERSAHLRAEVALFMRDHVLGVVSHDLRGPLNAIHSWGYVLERKVDTADAAAQRALAGIRSGVEQQVKLIEQFIDTTRAETKTLALDRAPRALRHLMEQSALEARASLASARQVTLHVESALVEEQISADGERLTQALWLMLAFATEASAARSEVVLNGLVEGGVFSADVTFTASQKALLDPDVPHVLEAFARHQATLPREAARIAWVLALCKRVAEAHGGTFEHDDPADNAAVALRLRVPLSAV